MAEYGMKVIFRNNDKVIPFSRIMDFLQVNLKAKLLSYELDETKRNFQCRFESYKLSENELVLMGGVFNGFGASEIHISGEIYSDKFD